MEQNNNDKQFEWTDDYALEFGRICYTNLDESVSTKEKLRLFKKSKEKVVEQPIKVTGIYIDGDSHLDQERTYYFQTLYPLPKNLIGENYSQLIEAIESVLNPTPTYNSNEKNKFGNDAITVPKEFADELRRHEKSLKEKECDYEILSYIDSGTNIIYTKNCCSHNSIYSNGFENYTGEFKNQPIFKIHSVLRKSDNQTFAVGDTVEDMTSETLHSFKISSFEVVKDSIIVSKEDSTFRVNLIYVKQKTEPSLDTKPLFTFQEIVEVVRTVNDGAKGKDNRSYLLEKLKEIYEQKAIPLNNK